MEHDPDLEQHLLEALEQKDAAEKRAGSVETRRTKLPETGQERSHVNRFERAEFTHALLGFRALIRDLEEKEQRTGEARDLLSRFRDRMHAYTKGLDALDRQFNDNGFSVEVEGEDTGRHQVPIAELDVFPPKEGEKDDRTPFFVVGGIASHYRQSAELAVALALEGHKVYAMTYPEQAEAEHPRDWGERLRKEGSLRLHANLVKQAIENIGLERTNLMGYSMGGAIALEAASDDDFNKKLDHLVVLDPVGFEEKGRLQMAYDFFIKQGSAAVRDPEARLKLIEQGREASNVDPALFLADADILRKKQFGPTKLAHENAQRFQVVLAAQSPIADARVTREALLSAEQERRKVNPDAVPLELYWLEHADHATPAVRAMGVVTTIEGKRPQGTEVVIDAENLENSLAAVILKDLRQEDQAK